MPLRRREFQFAGMQVLITGAASGIGRAVAVAAAREGARVHLMDRDESPLLAAAAEIRGGGGDVGLVEACDVSDHEAVASMAQRLTASYGAMDVIMNIAGISAWGTVRSMSHQTWRDLIEVNLMGPIHVIEELVPAMIDSGRGGALVNCSSAAGVIGMPWHAAYSASKFGLRGLSEVLRFDLAKHRISVSLVCPGGVDTGLTQTIRIDGVDTSGPEFTKARDRFRKHAVSPEVAANAILQGVRRRRYWIYTSPDIRFIHTLQRLFPPGYVVVMELLSRYANHHLPQVERASRGPS